MMNLINFDVRNKTIEGKKEDKRSKIFESEYFSY